MIPSAYSQATAPIVPENLIAGEGRSITVNISSGTRAALSVGTANSFGVNTNINARFLFQVPLPGSYFGCPRKLTSNKNHSIPGGSY